MARKFDELRVKMSQERRRRNEEETTKKLLDLTKLKAAPRPKRKPKRTA